MLPAAAWLTYAIFAYLLWSLIFHIRYRRSAWREPFPPRNLYGWIDFALGLSLVAYSAWIVFGPPPEPMFGGRGFWGGAAIGLAITILAVSLRLWAVITLGPNWRIGQDDHDPDATFVATGPYRLMAHPINTALVLVAIGQAFMTGLNLRSLFILTFSTTYLLIQARAEERHWARRRVAAAPSALQPRSQP